MDSSKYIKTLIIGFTISVTLVVALFVRISYLIDDVKTQQTLREQLITAQDKIIYYDEVLTMSARLASFTGKEEWSKRYLSIAPKLDEVISYVEHKSFNQELKNIVLVTNKANIELVKDELQALDLVKAGKMKNAQELLFSAKYLQNKKNYEKSMMDFRMKLNHRIIDYRRKITVNEQTIYTWSLIIFISIFVLWIIIIVKIVNISRELSIAHNKEVKQNQQLALLGELTLGLSHDIANPLSIIHAYSRMLLKKRDRDACNEYLPQIINTAEHAINLCKNVSSFSRKDSYEELELYLVDDIVESSLLMSSKRVAQDRIKIHKSYKINDSIYCNPSSIKQVLTNLIINAYDAISNLDIRWIEFKLERTEDYMLFYVIDSGQGIPEDVANHIFDFQFTTKDKSHGSGIGLAMSLKIMQQHEGDLFLDTGATNTTFVIKVPHKKSANA